MQVSWYCYQLKLYTMHLLLNQISGLFAKHTNNTLQNSELQTDYTNYNGFGNIFEQIHNGYDPANIAAYSQHELPLSPQSLAGSESILSEVNLSLNSSMDNTSHYKYFIDGHELNIDSQVSNTAQISASAENSLKQPDSGYMLSYNYAVLSKPVNLSNENLIQSERASNNHETTAFEKPGTYVLSSDYLQLSTRNKPDLAQPGDQTLLSESTTSLPYLKNLFNLDVNNPVNISRVTDTIQTVESLISISDISYPDGAEIKNNSGYIKSVNDFYVYAGSNTDKHSHLSVTVDMQEHNHQTKSVNLSTAHGTNSDINQYPSMSISVNDIHAIKAQDSVDEKELLNDLTYTYQKSQNIRTDHGEKEINNGLAGKRDGENYIIEKSVLSTTISDSVTNKELNSTLTRPGGENNKVIEEIYNNYATDEKQPLTNKSQQHLDINSDGYVPIATTNEQLDSTKKISAEYSDNKYLNQISATDATISNAKTSGLDKTITQLPGGFDETGSEEIVNQIIWAKNNSNHVKITLSPEHLGSLEINIERDKDGFNIQFTTQNTAAKETIESFIPRLKEMLEQQGLNLQNTNVSNQEKGHGNTHTYAGVSENNEAVIDELSDDNESTQAVSNKASSSYLLEAFA